MLWWQPPLLMLSRTMGHCARLPPLPTRKRTHLPVLASAAQRTTDIDDNDANESAELAAAPPPEPKPAVVELRIATALAEAELSVYQEAMQRRQMARATTFRMAVRALGPLVDVQRERTTSGTEQAVSAASVAVGEAESLAAAAAAATAAATENTRATAPAALSGAAARRAAAEAEEATEAKAEAVQRAEAEFQAALYAIAAPPTIPTLMWLTWAAAEGADVLAARALGRAGVRKRRRRSEQPHHDGRRHPRSHACFPESAAKFPVGRNEAGV